VLSVMLSVVMLSVVKLSVVTGVCSYAKCHSSSYCLSIALMLSGISLIALMLSVVMLNTGMPSAFMPSVVVPQTIPTANCLAYRIKGVANFQPYFVELAQSHRSTPRSTICLLDFKEWKTFFLSSSLNAKQNKLDCASLETICYYQNDYNIIIILL
jgi:hypothetical protein